MWQRNGVRHAVMEKQRLSKGILGELKPLIEKEYAKTLFFIEKTGSMFYSNMGINFWHRHLIQKVVRIFFIFSPQNYCRRHYP